MLEGVGRGPATGVTAAEPLVASVALRLLAKLTQARELLVAEDASDFPFDLCAQECGRGLRFGEFAGALAHERLVGLVGVDCLVERASRAVDAPHEFATFGVVLLTYLAYLADLFGGKIQTPQQAAAALRLR